MAGVSGIPGIGPALSRVQFETEYQVQALKLQQDAMEQVGQSAVQLIESAMAATSGVGGNLDISV